MRKQKELDPQLLQAWSQDIKNEKLAGQIFENLPGRPRDTDDEDVTLPNGIVVSCYERKGGYEGSGEHTHLIYEVTQGNEKVFYMISGYYQSYDGADYEFGDPDLVEQYQKTVTDWRKIQK